MSDNNENTEDNAEIESADVKKKCFWKKNTSREGVEKPFGLGLVILFACIVTIALIGYFTSKAALSVHMVEARLTEWNEMVKESAARKGYDASLSYGAITIEGGLFSKRAVIANPKVSLGLKGKEIQYISTAKIELLPDSSAMNKIRLMMPLPIKVLSGQEVQRYESSTPLEVRIVMEGEGQAYEAVFPSKVQIFKEGEVGAGDIPYATLETMLGGKVSGLIVAGAEEYSQHIVLSKTTYKTADRTLRMNSMDLLAEAAKEDLAHLTHYRVKIAGLYTSGMFSVLSPLDISADFDRMSPSTLVTQPTQPASSHKEMSYFVDPLVISSGASVLTMSGKFDLIPDEILPLGTAEINVTAVDNLLGRMRANGVLDTNSEDITRNLLKKVASEWTHGAKDNLKLVIEREYGGGFFIGDITFEELLALALKEYLLDAHTPDVVTSEKEIEDIVGTEIQAGEDTVVSGVKNTVPAPVAPVKDEKKPVNKADDKVTEVNKTDEHVPSTKLEEEPVSEDTVPEHGESTSAMESLEVDDAHVATPAASEEITPAAKDESVGESLKKIFQSSEH